MHAVAFVPQQIFAVSGIKKSKDETVGPSAPHTHKLVRARAKSGAYKGGVLKADSSSRTRFSEPGFLNTPSTLVPTEKTNALRIRNWGGLEGSGQAKGQRRVLTVLFEEEARLGHDNRDVAVNSS